MKTLVVFRSILGTSRQYAEWLAQRLECELIPFGQVKDRQLEAVDKVIVVSGTYAGWMPLVGFLKKHWQSLRDKKVVVVAVGLAPPDDEWSIRSYNKIPQEIRQHIEYFKLPGKVFEESPDLPSINKSRLEPVVKAVKKDD